VKEFAIGPGEVEGRALPYLVIGHALLDTSLPMLVLLASL
jgi:hypothetical protein